MKSSTSGSIKFASMCLGRSTRSIGLLRTDRTSEDRLQDKRVDLHMRQTKLINQKFVLIMYIWPRSGKNLIELRFGLMQFKGLVPSVLSSMSDLTDNLNLI